MLRSSPTARTRIDTPANTPPVNWRLWATRTSRITPRASRDGWKRGFLWRRLPKTYAARFFFRVGVSFLTNESPRFNSEVRSAVSVAIWTGSPADSSTSQRFNSSGEACTRRPSRVTGIPDFAHRWATDDG